MIVAAPVKFGRADSPISPLYGHAKYFTFIRDDDTIEVEENRCDGGKEVSQWLLHRGVGAVLVQHIGERPFKLLQEAGVDVYYVGDGRVLLGDAVKAFKEGKLLKIDQSNIERFIKHHQHHHGEHR